MSDSNDTLPDIYKFSPDIVRCPTVILSLVSYIKLEQFNGKLCEKYLRVISGLNLAIFGPILDYSAQVWGTKELAI